MINNTSDIRNVCFVGSDQHGKTTIVDRVLCDKPASTDYIMTTRSEIVSTHVRASCIDSEHGLLLNLIDTPGHPEFVAQTAADLRISDGLVLVVDPNEGQCTHTERILQRALTFEKIKPLLFINKLDTLFAGNTNSMSVSQALEETVQFMNDLLKSYGSDILDPRKGTVIFGSALHGWGIDIKRWARLYCILFNVDCERILNKFWGNHFYNTNDKKWRTRAAGSGYHGFTKFILEPIGELYKACTKNDKDRLDKILSKLNINQSSGNLREDELHGEELFHAVMRQFVPLRHLLIESIDQHLPSPADAQQYRSNILLEQSNRYYGDKDDSLQNGVATCDPNGPLLIYIYKKMELISGQVYFLARVFSGTLNVGTQIHVMPHRGSTTNSVIEQIISFEDRRNEKINNCSAGHLVGLVSIDTCPSTLVQKEKSSLMIAAPIPYELSASVMEAVIHAENQEDASALVRRLLLLSQVDPSISFYENGVTDPILYVQGPHHLQASIDMLNQQSLKVKSGDISVQYYETITMTSPRVCTRSPNRHSRITMRVEPVTTDFDKKSCWVHDSVASNVLLNQTRDVLHLHEFKEGIIMAFSRCSCQYGPLFDGPLLQCQVNIVDVFSNIDVIKRGMGQIIPMVTQAIRGGIVSAGPTIAEPVHTVEITCSASATSRVHTELSNRRGYVFLHEKHLLNGVKVVALLPVSETLALGTDLHHSGLSEIHSMRTMLHHWERIPGSAYEVDSQAQRIIRKLRKRRGLSEEVPIYAHKFKVLDPIT